MSNMNFQVDVENYLSFGFDAHKNKMLAMSLSNPSGYETARAEIVTKLRNKNVKAIYETLMTFMTTGFEHGTTIPISKGIAPSYPAQEASKFCLSASETLNRIFVDCVDIILPPPYSKVALQRD